MRQGNKEADLIYQGVLYRNGDFKVGDGEVVVGRQVLLRLWGYISVCPTLQLGHSGVPGVGLGWVLEPGGPESFPLSLGWWSICSTFECLLLSESSFPVCWRSQRESSGPV